MKVYNKIWGVQLKQLEYVFKWKQDKKSFTLKFHSYKGHLILISLKRKADSVHRQ